MNTMVSARVPVGLRDQVNKELRAIGSTPSELINRAYEFFLSTKTLPEVSSASVPGHRKLSASQAEELRKSLEATTTPVPEAYFQNKTYKELLEEKLRAAYEALY